MKVRQKQQGTKRRRVKSEECGPVLRTIRMFRVNMIRREIKRDMTYINFERLDGLKGFCMDVSCV